MLTPSELRGFLYEVFSVCGYVPNEEKLFDDPVEYLKFLKKAFIKMAHPDVRSRTDIENFGTYLEIFDEILRYEDVIRRYYHAGQLKGDDEYMAYHITPQDIERGYIEIEDERLPLPDAPRYILRGFGKPGLPPGDLIVEFDNVSCMRNSCVYKFKKFDATANALDGYKLSGRPVITLQQRNQGAVMNYKGYTLLVQEVVLKER